MNNPPQPPFGDTLQRRYSAAGVRFWVDPSHPYGDAIVDEAMATFAERQGARVLAPGRVAVLPVAGDPGVFDCALSWSQALLRDLSEHHDPETTESGIGVLIYPTLVQGSDSSLELVPEPFERDLEERPPKFFGLALTTRASRMLEVPVRFERVDDYQGPSGRRVPLVTAGSYRDDLPPWRNPELLGRRLKTVARPEIAADLEALLGESAGRVVGPIGCGKTRLVCESLRRAGRKFLWLQALPARRCRPSLGDQIIHHLLSPSPHQRSDPNHPALETAESRPEIRRELASWRVEGEGRESETLAAMTDLMIERLTEAGEEPITLIFDHMESLSPPDREFLDLLLGSPELGRRFRTLFVGRSEGWAGELAGLPTLRMPVLNEAQANELAGRMVEGLSLPDAVHHRLQEATRGNPLAFEEGLLGLLHERAFRSIHGSFFFGGDDDTDYCPSLRLVRHLESEAGRLGALAPLLPLAVAGAAAPVKELAATADVFELPTDSDWHRRTERAGLAAPADSPWGPGLTLEPPAFRYALSFLVVGETASRLRHQLGRLLAARSAAGEQSWCAYRLLAGSEEALGPLLAALSGGYATSIRQEELLPTLTNELRLARHRGCRDEQEMQLLWRLLPLARRMGRLAHYRGELKRAMELSAGRPDQILAIAGLKAELEHDAGENAEAESTIRRALRTATGSDIQRQALLLIQLGKILLRQGRSSEATGIFENLLTVLGSSTSPALDATCRFFLGNIALRDGRTEEAYDYHRQALEQRRQLELHRPTGSSLSALGSVSIARGNYPEALAYYRQAEETLERHGREGEVSFALLGVGRALSRVGDYAAASKPLRRALKLREGRDDIGGEAIARLAVAANFLALGQDEQALAEARKAHFQLSMSSQEEALGEAELLLGRIQLRQRKHPEARRHLEAALEIHRHHQEDLQIGFDHATLLTVAIALEDDEMVSHHVADLKGALDRLRSVDLGEVLHYRLFLGLEWLSRHGHKVGDPTPSLERAYRQVLDKARHLEPGQRSQFLFQIPLNQEIVETATRLGLAHPVTESA